MSTVERPLRADAERNRQRILEAARELFAERGLAVSLDDVAERAGLGVGTVYRRFASREELIDALFSAKLEELVGVARQGLEVSDPWEGLVFFLTEMAARQAKDRGLKEVLLGSAAGREHVGRIRERMRPLAEELVTRAQATGRLRADFAAADLPMLQMMVGTVADVGAEADPALWRRFLALLLDGMRAPGAERDPLPGPPLDLARLEDVMCRWQPARWRREP
jgi:AcrR family transcriptional regulator